MNALLSIPVPTPSAPQLLGVPGAGGSARGAPAVSFASLLAASVPAGNALFPAAPAASATLWQPAVEGDATVPPEARARRLIAWLGGAEGVPAPAWTLTQVPPNTLDDGEASTSGAPTLQLTLPLPDQLPPEPSGEGAGFTTVRLVTDKGDLLLPAVHEGDRLRVQLPATEALAEPRGAQSTAGGPWLVLTVTPEGAVQVEVQPAEAPQPSSVPTPLSLVRVLPNAPTFAVDVSAAPNPAALGGVARAPVEGTPSQTLGNAPAVLRAAPAPALAAVLLQAVPSEATVKPTAASVEALRPAEATVKPTAASVEALRPVEATVKPTAASVESLRPAEATVKPTAVSVVKPIAEPVHVLRPDLSTAPRPAEPVVIPIAPRTAASQPVNSPNVALPEVVAARQLTPERLEIDLKIQSALVKPAVKGFARLPLISDAVRMQIASQPPETTARPGMPKPASLPVQPALQPAVETTIHSMVPATAAQAGEPILKRVVENLARMEKAVESFVVQSGGKDAHVVSTPAMAEKLSASPLPRFAVKEGLAASEWKAPASEGKPASGSLPTPAEVASSSARAFAETARAALAPSRETAPGAERIVTTPAQPAPAAAPAAPAASPATAVTVPQPGDAPVLDQVVKGAEIMARDGKTTMSVRLVPEHLGRLDIRLDQEGGRITAQIVAREAATEQLLLRNFDQLHRALESAGLRVQQISVVPAPTVSVAHAAPQEAAPVDRYAGQDRSHQNSHGGHGHNGRHGQRSPHNESSQEWWG